MNRDKKGYVDQSQLNLITYALEASAFQSGGSPPWRLLFVKPSVSPSQAPEARNEIAYAPYAAGQRITSLASLLREAIGESAACPWGIQSESHKNPFSPPYPGALPVEGHAQGENETSQDASLDDTNWSSAGRGRAERGVFGDCSIEQESGYVPAANRSPPWSESPRL